MRPTNKRIEYRRAISIMLVFMLAIGTFCFNSQVAEAKGSLSSGDCVKNVLVYAVNSQGQQVLVSQLNVSDMLTYLNANLGSYGAVHNYSILDKLVTPVHQEAQGFTVAQMMDYAESKSTLSNLNLSFSGNDSVAFWEIDGSKFDTTDTYTYSSLYGVNRYNFPALYQYWDYDKQAYKDVNAIWASRKPETPLLSITAFTQRYIDTHGKCDINDYNMEGYFDSQSLLDTAKTVRLMLPMTESELRSKTSTANNSRYGICYMLLDMTTDPVISAGTVEAPTYTVIDGDASTTDSYDAGYCYFTLSCKTPGANIYYNDSSNSTYMPTALYTEGQEIKVPKEAGVASLKVRAVKDGCVDSGVQMITNAGEEDYEETVDPDADVWDGVTTAAAVGTYVDGVYTIGVDTCAQLKWVADQVNSGSTSFAGVTIRLGNNLHLNKKEWKPIGDLTGVWTNSYHDDYFSSFDTYTYLFAGTFDGNGYTVSGLNPVALGPKNGRCGLFGAVSGATVKDLTVSGVIESGNNDGIGAIAGEAANSTFENCTSRARIKSDPDFALLGHNRGGIAGTANGCTFTNCINYGTINGNASSINGFGGIVGKTAGGVITGCENYGSVSCSSDGYCGGIIGIGETVYGAAGSGTAGNCTNHGAIKGGGIVGNGNASYCTNFGDVDGSGIVAKGSASRCINNGTVAGSGITGVGSADACVNTGSTANGLLFGGNRNTGSYSRSSLTNSYNIGSASNAGLAGTKDTNISNCYNANGGAALGTFENNTMTLSTIYYLSAGTQVANDAGIDLAALTSMTEPDMQNASFVSTLNTNAGASLFAADTTGISGGFPKFSWESGVMFEEGNGKEYIPWHLITGSLCPEPEDAVRSGYTFTGWYSDEKCTTHYDFSSPVTADVTLYAGWEKNDLVKPLEKEIVLSWTGDPTTTQTVTWHDGSGAGYVQYVSADRYKDASSFSAAGQVEASPSSVGTEKYFQATITNLDPDTKYYYRVGSSGDWSGVYSFTTAKTGTRNFSFMYMGDVQCTDASGYQEWGTLLEHAYTSNPAIAFGLMGGDMVNDESVSNMSDWNELLSYAGNVFSKIPMMTAVGNHESNLTGGKPLIYTAILGLPTNGPAGFSEEFYSFNYGTAHVTVLNSWALSGEQNLSTRSALAVKTWIANDLASAANAKFRIVVLHHPAYALENDAVSSKVLSDWAPLLEAGNVDLVFCGHQHVYARSKPLLGGTVTSAGITYVMGNSGQKFYTEAKETYQAKVIYNTSTYQIVDISGNNLNLYTYDGDGTLLDSWSKTSKFADVTGDVNGDGKVNMDDVNLIFNAYLKYYDYNSNMDVNSDGVVDIRDAHLVLNIYLGKAS